MAWTRRHDATPAPRAHHEQHDALERREDVVGVGPAAARARSINSGVARGPRRQCQRLEDQQNAHERVHAVHALLASSAQEEPPDAGAEPEEAREGREDLWEGGLAR